MFLDKKIKKSLILMCNIFIYLEQNDTMKYYEI